ncbi:YecA family protein [Niallia sp. Krafla_26]|uniref:YecA family protein n=1 Tax=Niallia sp. Krafla_26 TaxID=3064703 RepID=UPI003D17A537
MSVKRNDPCPCGSGKKYKKCCLIKDHAIALKQAKRERFFELKHEMVRMASSFTSSKVSFKERFILENTFRKRINAEIPKDVFNSFFQFYLLFFHEFENNRRGVEWFYEERGETLLPELKELAQRWTTLTPTLIQAVNHDENGISVETYPSNETVYMPYCETLPNVKQGKVTFGLIEPFDHDYYLNGVTAWAVPGTADMVKNEIDRLIAKTGKSYNEIVIEYYPELISIIINHTNVRVSSEDNDPKQVIQEKLTDSTKEKETSLSQLAEPEDTVEMNEAESPYFQQLGFTPETATKFYGQDIVDFFLEKTDGKTERTIAKYENSLKYLVDYFSSLDESVDSWDARILDSLEQLISDEEFELNNIRTKTQKKAIESTVNAFIKWIEKRYELNSLVLEG